MKQILVAVAIMMVCLVPGVSQAITIFDDNFDGETNGLNYVSFANWTVSAGTVDVIGLDPPASASFDFLPGNGNYVDMDGSTLDAGIMQSNAPLSVVAGTAYLLSFDLAGSQRSSASGDVVPNTVAFGIDIDNNGSIDISGPPITLGTFTPFSTFTLPFIASGAFTNPRIQFGQTGTGGDNRGLLLDRVTVQTAVPEPASLILLGAGLAGIGIWRWKSSRS